MYRMLTGKTPDNALDRLSVLKKKHRDPLKPIHKLNRKVSAGRENAILNAMNVYPENRTATVKEFLE